MSFFIGIDIGGTKTAVGLVDVQKGVVIRKEIFPTPRTSVEVFFRELDSCMKAMMDAGELKGIGVGVAGIVNREDGVIVRGPNLGKSFQEYGLRDRLQGMYSLPVTLDNDARCFTLAESVFGLGKGKRSVFGVTLGTGIGGGYVVDGKVVYGNDDVAGEIGHMVLEGDSNEVCSCGQVGHLEALASGKAMSRQYQSETGEEVDMKELEVRANGGDLKAVRIVQNGARALAKGLSSVIHLIDPEVLILGGGLIRMPIYIEESIKEIPKHFAFKEIHTSIYLSQLGDDAQIIGAAYQAQRM
jgi:glucokinase